MKYQLTAIGMVVALGAGGVVSAQSGATGKGQMDKGMMKEGSMTVTGCVAAEALARIKWAAADITLISRADACASPYEEPVGAMTPQGGQ